MNDFPPLQCRAKTNYVDIGHLAIHCGIAIEQYLESNAYKNCREKHSEFKTKESLPYFMHPFFAYDIIKFSNCQNGDALWIKILRLMVGDECEKVIFFLIIYFCI